MCRCNLLIIDAFGCKNDIWKLIGFLEIQKVAQLPFILLQYYIKIGIHSSSFCDFI